MIISVVYLLVRCLLGCLMVLTRHQVSKDAELLVLRHENAVFAARPAGSGTSRATGCGWHHCRDWFPAARWDEVFMVTPATPLTWHRWLVTCRWDYTSRRRPGRPPTAAAIRKLVIRIATDAIDPPIGHITGTASGGRRVCLEARHLHSPDRRQIREPEERVGPS